MSLSLLVVGCPVAAILYVLWSLLLRRIIFPSPLDNLPGPPSTSYLKGVCAERIKLSSELILGS